MTPSRGIAEQSNEPHDETEQEAAGPSDVVGAGELDTVVVEDCVPTENLGQDADTEVIQELGNDDAKGGTKGRTQHEGGSYPLDRVSGS